MHPSLTICADFSDQARIQSSLRALSEELGDTLGL